MNISRTRVILNPAAKGTKAARFTDEIRQLAEGLDVRVTTGRDSAQRLAEEAVADGVEMVVAAGGDGTINQVVNGIAESDVVLGVLPVGTMNVFASELGIPGNVDAAWNILLTGVDRRVDLGEAGGRYFVQLAGMGLDAQIVQETPLEFRKNFGPLSYLVSAAQIASRKPPVLRVMYGDGKVVEGSFVLVGNGRFYGGPVAIFKEARMDDGLLDVLVFKNQGVLDLMRYFQGALMGTHVQMPDVEYLKVASARIESEATDLPVEVDGEVIGYLPVSARVVNGALRVRGPR